MKLECEYFGEIDIPDFEGTSIEMRWATDLRTPIVERYGRRMSIKVLRNDADLEEAKRWAAMFLRGVQHVTDPNWWIERRDEPYEDRAAILEGIGHCMTTKDRQLAEAKEREQKREVETPSPEPTTNQENATMKAEYKYFGELELPELSGSEKQIAWAEKIRNNMIERLGEVLESNTQRVLKSSCLCAPESTGQPISSNISAYSFNPSIMQTKDENLEKMKTAVGYFLKGLPHFTEARWWIDERDRSFDMFAVAIAKQGMKQENEPKKQEQETETISPENPTHPGKATVKLTKDCEGNEMIVALYEKNQDFINTVKPLGYKWEGKWTKYLTYRTGNTDDRIVEVANKLLNAGFVVVVPAGLRERIINAEYEPEVKFWIIRQPNNKRVVYIDVPYGHHDQYLNAVTIGGARWVGGWGVEVSVEHYEEIRDFAEVNGYKFSQGAEENLQAAQEEREKILSGAVAVKSKEPEQKTSAKQKLEEKLENHGVIDDLIDND